MGLFHTHGDSLSNLLTVSSAEESRFIRRIVITGCIVNVILMALKLTVGYFGHSDALMADGYHSLSDFGADLIMLFFIGISFRKPDSKYSYGYGKFETFSTFLISLFLLFIAFHITDEAIDSIREYIAGYHLPKPDIWTVVVVIVSMFCKEFLFRYYRAASRKTGVMALLSNAWHHRSDALASIATLIGVTFAHFLGESWRILDPVASLILVIFIIVASIKMLIPAFRELMDRSCDPSEIKRAERIVENVSGVLGIKSIKSRKNGHFHLFDVNIEVEPSMTITKAEIISSEIMDKLKESFGKHILVNVITSPFYKDVLNH